MAKIKREIKSYIEAELRDYNQTLRDISEARQDLLLATHTPDNVGGHGYDIGDPTQARAFKLVTNRRISHMERICTAIATVIGALPEEKYRLVELKYWTRPQTLTDDGIALKLNISRRTYYNWKNGIIMALAEELGLINTVRLHKDCTFRGA